MASDSQLSHWSLVRSQSVMITEVEMHNYAGDGTVADPYIVEWLPDDPRNPFNWSAPYKWMIVIVMGLAVGSVSLCSSMYSGAEIGLLDEFNTNEEIATLGLSVFVLGFALGPMIWAPLSELYGRQILFIVSFGGLTAFNAGIIGASNIWTVIILRFLAGSFGSSPLTNAGGVIADIFTSIDRGIPMAVFGSAPFLGPLLGPIIGGFSGEALGWRWTMGLMAISSGAMWITVMLLTPETYAPILLRRRARALTKRTGKHYRSKLDDNDEATFRKVFTTALCRPWVLLLAEPIVLVFSIYLAIVYGSLYMLFSSYPIIFQQSRGWSQGVGGLAFIGILVGLFVGFTYLVFVDGPRYQETAKRLGGTAPPEARLTAARVGSIALPVGMLWFAWTAQPSVHWAASVTAGVPFGFGMVLVFLSVMEYLIDAYTVYAASALAANTVLRSLFGAGFPLFTSYMYRNLGINWASTIPAGLALACAPFPFLFYRYGAKLRKRCRYAAEAGRLSDEINVGDEKRSEGDSERKASSSSSSDNEKTDAEAC